ncbi:YqiA/YcfP family alpha/beta fold hydrolase [Rheinheimera sp.]|uniref:YqiA/YcfP family alpha/beta fold hydrolase n=1 Tax=Rheinheimera sp. TaxID=1869214 RepID=UPI00307F0134
MKLALYLHGFASSSLSEKALQTRDYFTTELPHVELLTPDLPYTPEEAIATIELALQGRRPDAVIGSSLGGFLATWVAERYGCKAVLVNPAVQPDQLLSQHLGLYRHPVLQQDFLVNEQQMPKLRALERQPTNPGRYLVLLQSGDEVLDYRKAQQWYQGCQIETVQGGDHSFVGYANYLPAIVKFCQFA